MKRFIIFSIFFVPILLNAQKSIRFIAGVNYTHVHRTGLFYGFTTDTLTIKKQHFDPIILPHLGFEYDFKTSNKLSYTIGLGISMMGTANYDTLPASFSPKYPTRHQYDLKITYLRIPLMIKYELLDQLYVFGGYTLNFSINRNKTLLWADFEREPAEAVYNVYSNYYHAGILGLRKDWKNLSISANYHLGLNRIYDTGYASTRTRIYMSMSGIQMSLGYKISE